RLAPGLISEASAARPGPGTLTGKPVSQTQVKIQPENHLMVGLLGQRDELLRLIEASFDAKPFVRGNEITVEGPDAARVGTLINELVLLLEQGHVLDSTNVGRTIDMVKADERPSEVLTAEVLRSARGRSIRPKTSGQKRYADAIDNNVITFVIGPAGTGKSYIAVAQGVQALQDKQVNRIILTRPAVEAGERLGLEKVLNAIEGLRFVHLTARDVVRHRIVQDIVTAYEKAGGDRT